MHILVWLCYNKHSQKIKNFGHIEPPRELQLPGGFISGLLPLVLAVKPLAYVVADYTCRDRQQKIKNHSFGHVVSPPSHYWAGVGQ